MLRLCATYNIDESSQTIEASKAQLTYNSFGTVLFNTPFYQHYVQKRMVPSSLTIANIDIQDRENNSSKNSNIKLNARLGTPTAMRKKPYYSMLQYLPNLTCSLDLNTQA